MNETEESLLHLYKVLGLHDYMGTMSPIISEQNHFLTFLIGGKNATYL
jgi:hypothetical protein